MQVNIRFTWQIDRVKIKDTTMPVSTNISFTWYNFYRYIFDDTENEKIVFFYPEDDVNLHSKHVGLIEALITFMTVFSEQPASVQHNLKTKTIFREFEPGFCMVLCVAVPYRVKSVNGEVKDTNYSSEKLHDNVLEAILQRTYELFKVDIS